MSDETERADERFRNLEALPSRTLLEALIGGQDEALRAVRDALPRIDAAVEAAARRLDRPQARLAYCGAGTSGRLAMLDGVELGPTFSWPAERCVYLLAGGSAAFSQAREGAEDEESAAHTAIREAGIGRDDVVVALAASGRTPYTIAAVRSARARGALTIGFANNPGTPLLDVSEHPVLLRTGPEVLAGSTRLAAGTAQKAALNLFSTAVMVRLGKVFRGRMVDMRPSNRKLRERARRMVAEVAGCDEADAEAALQATGGAIREAILKLEARNGVSRGAAPAAGDAATDNAGAGAGAGPSAPARTR